MIVNSLNFLLFFTVVFFVYYLPPCRRNAKMQNAWLFLTSYVFYGVADWKMIPLLLCATVVFYGLGLRLKGEMEKRHASSASRLTTLGVVLGVGLLLYFKYLNFFIESFASLLNAVGLNVTWTTLNIVLPVGVSFFTFKLISYLIEIHREHIEPSRDFIEFAAYIAFFPTLLSGPIDRPGKFIPQLKAARQVDMDMLTRGGQQILWGMFKKMVIADNLMVVVNTTWELTTFSGSTYILAALLYPAQMYADFSGYSDMAIGVGKLLGIKVAPNFFHPFFARNIAEYWRNWHISLTGWLTDYVFSPLNIAFRNLQKQGIILAIVINFIVIGFWHGAKWTFGCFGLYHGLLYVPLILSGNFGKRKKLKTGKFDLPSPSDIGRMALTYVLVAVGLVLFRAESVGAALSDFALMCQQSALAIPRFVYNFNTICMIQLLILMVCMVVDWRNRQRECPIFFERSFSLKAVSSYALIVVLIYFLGTESSSFIYFKF